MNFRYGAGTAAVSLVAIAMNPCISLLFPAGLQPAANLCPTEMIEVSSCPPAASFFVKALILMGCGTKLLGSTR